MTQPQYIHLHYMLAAIRDARSHFEMAKQARCKGLVDDWRDFMATGRTWADVARYHAHEAGVIMR